MIDLHCHILYGIDDGPKTIEESIEMAKMAVDQGITHILCTPHHLNREYTNPANQVIIKTNRLQKELEAQNIPLELYGGQEVHLSEKIIDEFKQHNILTVDLSEKYFLLEFPTTEIPIYANALIQQLIFMNKTPIIVHPERQKQFLEDPNLMIDYIDMGCLFQLTAPSICGHFGKKVKKVSELMIDHNLVHMIASDAHNTTTRPFMMDEAFNLVRKKYGKDVYHHIKRASFDALNGEEVITYEPEVVRKKFFLF